MQGLEDRYYNLYQNATDGLFTIDQKGYLHDANKMCERITGYSREELEKTHYTRLLARKEKRFISHYFGMLIKGQLIPRDDLQVEIVSKNGRTKVMELHIKNAIFEDGLIQASIRDITDKKKLEKRLLSVQRMECIGKLVNDVSHKFNDIVTGILGSSAYLKNALTGNEDYYQYVEAIEKSALIGAELLSKLMVFDDNQKYYSQVSDINEVIRETVKLVNNGLHQIEIISRLESGSLLVQIEKQQIMQAIINICYNALDAMPNGGRLTITTESQDLGEDFCFQHLGLKEGQYVHIQISDTGHGIDEKFLPYIFDPFFTTKDVGKGTGLGLSVAFGIANSHQGTILADSKRGVGSDFDIYLPAYSSLAVREEAGEICDGEGTVMVVEDEDLVRKMTFNILTRSGYEVFCAADGEEAIDLYKNKKNSIDLVVLDMFMPRKDGLETFKELKKIDRDIRVVISTGYIPNHISSEFVKGGVMGFIQKPYTAMELYKLLRRVLA